MTAIRAASRWLTPLLFLGVTPGFAQPERRSLAVRRKRRRRFPVDLLWPAPGDACLRRRAHARDHLEAGELPPLAPLAQDRADPIMVTRAT